MGGGILRPPTDLALHADAMQPQVFHDAVEEARKAFLDDDGKDAQGGQEHDDRDDGPLDQFGS